MFMAFKSLDLNLNKFRKKWTFRKQAKKSNIQFFGWMDGLFRIK